MPTPVTFPTLSCPAVTNMTTFAPFFLFLSLFSSPAAVAQIPTAPPASSILLQFKANISSDPNGALTSWTTAGDPCRDFAGVFCDDSGAVVKVVVHSADLTGSLSASLAGLPSLQAISLFDNRFSGGVPAEYAAISTLRKLNLSRNELSGAVPDFLGDISGLRLLDLSYNSFSGEIPPSLFKNCVKTRYVSLSHNKLTGGVPTDIANCSKLVGIDFSYNNLSGEFVPEICDPPDINYVSLGSNSMSGTVADKVTRCQSLELFDIGSNQFTGLVPFYIIDLQNISYFNMSFNYFRGEIPDIGACSGRLRFFDVSGNGLSGRVPSSIANCHGLRFLDLTSNNLSGSIPAEIGRLKSLSVIRLGDNAGIRGSIPEELRAVELLLILDLQNLQLSGEIPSALSQCQFLLELDVSGNQLQGVIPDTLYNFTYLQHLDLHRNQLNGSIPSTLGQLTRLTYLDLSENLLTGAIPDSLGNLTLLTYFNASYNNLSGAIPSSVHQFGAPAFYNNPLLCGPPLNNLCSSGNGSRKTRFLSVSAIVALVASTIILIGVCVIMIMNCRASDENKVEEILVSESTSLTSNGGNGVSSVIIGKLVLFSKTLPSRYEDWETGTKALLDKDCIIGVGSVGTVYKATMEGGVSIAVKKLEKAGRLRNQDEFEQEMGRLGTLRHPNLVAFQGYYWSTTMKLILSEFVPNGNLYDHLHSSSQYSGSSGSGSQSQLFWSRRFKIALGTARALAYLHEDCKPQLLHLNIKSTNILLDGEYEPKLSDYGFRDLLPILGSYASTKFHAAVGYVAPELASQSLRYSVKCDVYSFGVVLLEIVTGRKPVDSLGAMEVVVLRDYVREILENGTPSDCFDRSLRDFEEAELIQVLKLGLICTSDAPSRRPSMAEVVQFLESIKQNS